MIKYWAKNRLILDIIAPIVIVLFLLLAFFSPMFANIGEKRQVESLYENGKLDFDIPSPSYEQIAQLENESFIESVFPYIYTETSIDVNGKSRNTKIFLYDAYDKLEQTMYCESRLIEKSDENYSNPILIDYQFAKETGAKIGTVVSLTAGITKIDFQVSAIYESNVYYDGGAVMAKYDGAQKEVIASVMKNTSYSGAYIQASDYQKCKQYLQTEYKPYGRLKDESEFATPEAYEIHYNAIMSANYANEITDFAAKAQDANAKARSIEGVVKLYTVLACAIMCFALVVYNIIMWIRKSERGYFASRKMSGAKNIGVYYLLSSILQSALLICVVIVSLWIVSSNSTLYIPKEIIISKYIIFIITSIITSAIIVFENLILAKKTNK